MDSEREQAPRTAPNLYLSFQCHQPLAPSVRYCLAGASQVSLHGRATQPSVHRSAEGKHLVIDVDDPKMSRQHATVVRRGDAWVIGDDGSTNGTIVRGIPVAGSGAELRDGDVIEAVLSFFVFRPNEPLDHETLVEESTSVQPIAPFVHTLSPRLRDEFAKLALIAAQSEVPVLVRGESGSGKEAIARAVHLLSGRSGAFVAKNCSAIPEPLCEAEFFGHRRGAFSDAKEDRPGLFRAATGGTLFLDEIGELHPKGQAVLLRALEDREVIAVGDVVPTRVDTRIVAATNRDLGEGIRGGSFRLDLFHRLGTFRLTLPALRERLEDLGLIVAAILRAPGSRYQSGQEFHVSAGQELFRRAWPGNIRELRNELHVALLVANGARLTASHFQQEEVSADLDGGDEPAPGRRRPSRAELADLLARHQGNVSAVARALKKTRKSIWRWMTEYGLSAADAD